MSRNLRLTTMELARLQSRKPRNKYGATKVIADGHEFDSKVEAQRYHELKLQEKAGLIRELGVHPKYDLAVNGLLICSYEADFAYKSNAPTCVAPGSLIVEDVKCKATMTAVYRLKKKLMKAVLGIDIVET